MSQASLSPSAWRWLRRGTQTIAFLAVTVLVVLSVREGGHAAQAVVERFSPLLAVSAMIAARAVILAFWPALIIVVLSLVMGRAFCGWLCPLGAVIDATDALIERIVGRFRKRKRRRREENAARHRQWRFLLLLVVVGLALFGLPAAGWFDPLSLWPRTIAAGIFPYGETLFVQSEAQIAYQAPPHEFPSGHLVVTVVIALILLLGLVRKRFYCRYVCPTGGLISLLGWTSRLRRHVPEGACTNCTRCSSACRMGAIHADGVRTAMTDCTLCMDCLDVRGCRLATFTFGGDEKARALAPTTPTAPRRAFLRASAGGVVAVGFIPGTLDARPGVVIRPPGVHDEEEFLGRCVTCGECMRVCPTGGLRPVHFEAGAGGLWTPKLVPTHGPCTYDCARCGDVCPTSAIPRLPLPTKRKAVLGLARIDRKRCWPWLDQQPCVICQKYCPVQPNAVALRKNGRYDVPHILEEYCTGCGICEFMCPVTPRAVVIDPPARARRGGDGKSPPARPDADEA